MQIDLLNSSFEKIHVLDVFTSLIWTDRYWECGDFEIVMPPTAELLEHISNTKYLSLPESPHKMILEDSNIHTEIEDGDELIITGRSLESILDRRIAWYPIALSGNLQTNVQTLLSDNVYNTGVTQRNISEFNYVASTDPIVTALTIDTQFYGEKIYDILINVCKANGIGFKILYNESTTNWDFSLYSGVDRSYDQTTNQYVAFTTALENLRNSDYIESDRPLRTVALVAGQAGVGNVRPTTTVYAPGSSSLAGLARRELYFEANVTRNTPSGELTEAEYLLQLEGRGKEELAKRIYLKAFDGEIDTKMYNYGDDFGMGDIIQIADKYGHGTQSRVIEMIYSQDKEAIKIYPTFETVE